MPPFETFFVPTLTASAQHQSPEVVAEQVTAVYKRVSELGGMVVAQDVIDGPVVSTHSSPLNFPQNWIQKLRNTFDDEPAEAKAQIILITADIPEQSSPEV